MRALEEQVKTDGACTLPGVSIAYDLFMPIMMRAVARGYVKQEQADFVANGLRYGFDLGVDVSKLRVRRCNCFPLELRIEPFWTGGLRGAFFRWAQCPSRWSQVRCARSRTTPRRA